MSALSENRADGRQKWAEEEHIKLRLRLETQGKQKPFKETKKVIVTSALEECAKTWQSVVSEKSVNSSCYNRVDIFI